MGTQEKPAARPVRHGNVEILAASNGYIVLRDCRRGDYVAASEQFVFQDFAALTAWLKKNLRHGNGVEP